MKNQEILKKIAARYALKYITANLTIGVGSGSTVNYFINELQKKSKIIKGVVPASISSSEKLKSLNIPLLKIKDIKSIDLYIDSADEVDDNLMMIKGGGGALTCEKILVGMSKKFIGIADEYKKVNVLGKFPLPIEILPIAYNHVMEKLLFLGGLPKLRKNFFTDHGNIIIDIYQLKISNPKKIETQINMIPGVITVGLFTHHKANFFILAKKNNTIKIIHAK
ncbi:MAG: ribose-5-phosphate isomerase RpiA [Arsenophonus sp.]|nr:MAG: ribose-5-phosphate isomerase RpiA [Arsenophonus sp.]